MALISPSSLVSKSASHPDTNNPLWRKLCILQVKRDCLYWTDENMPQLKIGEWVWLLEDPSPRHGFLSISHSTPDGKDRVKQVPSMIFDLDSTWPNHYFGVLHFILGHANLFTSILGSVPSFKLGEILSSCNLLDRALTTMFQLEIDSKRQEMGTLFRNMTPAMILASTVYSLPAINDYKRALLVHLIEVALSRLGSKHSTILEKGLDATELSDFYIYALEEGCKHLLNTRPPDELIILIRSLKKVLSENELSMKYLLSFFFFRIISTGLSLPNEVEKTFQEHKSVKTSALLTEKLPRKRSSVGLTKIRKDSDAARHPSRLSRDSAELHIDLDVLKVIETELSESHSAPTSPTKDQLPSPSKDDNDQMSTPRRRFSLKSGSKISPKEGSLESPKAMLVKRTSVPSPREMENREQKKDSPKIKNAFQNPAILKYLAIMARLYTHLSSNSPSESDPVLNSFLLKVTYLRPLMETIVIHIAECQIVPLHDGERRNSFHYEMGEIYEDLLRHISQTPELISPSDRKFLVESYGNAYDEDLVRLTSKYLSAHI